MRAHSRTLMLAINSRVTPFSYQSLMPAGAGTPRYERLELWFFAANSHGGFCHAQPRPQRGTSPSPREVFDRTTFPIPTPLDSGLRRNDDWGAGVTKGCHESRSGARRMRVHPRPRNVIFVPIAHPGWRRHAKV